MKRHHPYFVLLVLMLGFGVLSAGFAAYSCSAGSAALFNEVEDDEFSESMEELPEEQLDVAVDFFSSTCCSAKGRACAAVHPPCCRSLRIRSHYCSFGWLLPLRI